MWRVIYIWLACSRLATSIRHGTYLPIDETSRWKVGHKQSFTSRMRQLQAQNKKLRFVFGFSTGHVGTTSLSTVSAYNASDLRSRNIAFAFEEGGVPPKTCASEAWSLVSEIHHVEYFYGPDVLLKHANFKGKNSAVIADFSHANLCFYRGLVHVLQGAGVPFHFIRITRAREETIISMTIQDGEPIDFFKHDYFRFHPFEQQQRVLLAIPGGVSTWRKFSPFQRACWVIDETQARWEQLLQQERNISFSQTQWSKEDDNLFSSVQHASNILGVAQASGPPPVTKIHAGKQTRDDRRLQRCTADDRAYRRIMGFTQGQSTPSFSSSHQRYSG